MKKIYVKAPIPRKQGLKLQHSPRQRYVQFQVKAPIPRKQGLKLKFVLMQISGSLKCESAHSKKTRIETLSESGNDSNPGSESAHSKKTRIETISF